jgi:K+-sensing histidine kinase KdpD
VVRWLGGLLVSVALVAVVSGLIALLEPRLPASGLPVLYLLAVLPVALVWGTVLAAFTSILSVVVFAYLFAPPIHSIRVADSRDLAAIGVFLVTAVVVGELAARSRREAREAARLAEEQSALRRVATLVAQAESPQAASTRPSWPRAAWARPCGPWPAAPRSRSSCTWRPRGDCPSGSR